MVHPDSQPVIQTVNSLDGDVSWTELKFDSIIYQTLAVTNNERFLQVIFALDRHLSAQLAGLEFVPAFSDIRVVVPGGDVHQLIDFKLHLEEKREIRWNNLTARCPMTRTYLDDDGASIAALDHQLRVVLDTGRL